MEGSLPLELWDVIFSFTISKKTKWKMIVPLLMVCKKKWNERVTDFCMDCDPFYLDIYPYVNFFSSVLPQIGKHIITLKLPCAPTYDEQLIEVTRWCINLQNLDLRLCSCVSSDGLASLCSLPLQDLRLPRCLKSEWSKHLFDCLAQMPTLKSIEINWWDINDGTILESCQHLISNQHFLFYNTPLNSNLRKLRDIKYGQIAKFKSQLQKVVCVQDARGKPKKLGKLWPNQLKCLEVSAPSKVTKLRLCADNFGLLTKLALDFSVWTELKRLDTLPNLHSLSLLGMRMGPDNNILAKIGLANFPKLKYLAIRPGIQETYLCPSDLLLLGVMPKLKCLHLPFMALNDMGGFSGYHQFPALKSLEILIQVATPNPCLYEFFDSFSSCPIEKLYLPTTTERLNKLIFTWATRSHKPLSYLFLESFNDPLFYQLIMMVCANGPITALEIGPLNCRNSWLALAQVVPYLTSLRYNPTSMIEDDFAVEYRLTDEDKQQLAHIKRIHIYDTLWHIWDHKYQYCIKWPRRMRTAKPW